MYFDVIHGDKETAFKEINSIALNKSAAEKIFGNENPIGKMLTIKHFYATSNRELNLMVTAVFKDYPSNSNFQPPYLIPMESLKSVADWGNEYDNYFTAWLQGWWTDSYVVFRDGTDIENIENELRKMVAENLGEYSDNYIPFLKKITDLHFDNEVQWYNKGMGDINHLYIFGSIAIFLILIASINYMNLATARSVRRSREVGMRKVMGSSRSQLIFQFIIESFVTTVLSMIICLLIVSLVLRVFNTLAQKDFVFSTFFNIRLIAGMAVILFMVAILAGSYPAFYLSNFKPVQILKGGKLNLKGSDSLRKILVIFQFFISIVMLICSGVLMKQINLMKTSKLNEQGEQIISIRYGGTAPIEKYSVYKHSVLEDPNFTEVTLANHLPRLDYFGWIGATVKIPDVSDQEYQWKRLNVEFNFPEVFNLEFLTGRNFITENPADSDACLINEAAIKNLGIDIAEAVGLRIEDPRSKSISTVIGVVKDFPYESMHQTIGPLIINTRPHPNDQIVYVKLPVKNMQKHIQTLESKWKELLPGIGFDYWFVNDEFNRLYESETRMSDLSEIFSIIAIFIACLGLFGLALYITEQRIKEISIRKVMGATEKQILVLFLNLFFKMLIISALIAGPVAYILMNKWLQQFVYRVSIDWKIMLSAFGIVFGLTLLTVIYEVIKASTANPVNAIRYE
jgi:putative ABC transport system permease protein